MIETKNLVKSFKNGPTETLVLKGIDLLIKEGEFVAIVGRSGAGKSTLLYQLSLLDEPTSGDVIVDGHSTHKMSDDEEVLFRLRKFGYVFQDYALLPELTALENVALPLLMQKMSKKSAYAKAATALKKVGIEKPIHNLPAQLSGGEQQRVSIARAVAHEPKVLFADEPTANLDRESSQLVMDIFKELHAGGQTIIMVTHEEEYTKLAQRVIRIDDGKVVSDEKHRSARS